MPPALVAVLVAVGAYFLRVAILHVGERLWPAERGQSWRDWWLSARCGTVLLGVTPLVGLVSAWATATLVSRSLLDWNLGAWTAGTGAFEWWLTILVLPWLPLLVFDFFYYWHHRLQHTVAALWAQHRLHHADEALCAFTSLRHHWLEDFFRIVTMVVPMALLIHFTSPPAALAVGGVLGYWTSFEHANIQLPFGPLTPILAGPQYHRIHHSREAVHQDRNFAAFFPLWDIVFGTYYRPRAGEWPRTGLASGERITTLGAALLDPFRLWARMLRPR